MSKSSVSGTERLSLVDIAEDALRRWLATGRHRVGERLPPEQELSGQLGISRGTLRTALGRLEKSGEIVRRQGSGTYVGHAASVAGRLDEGLEKLVSYSEASASSWPSWRSRSGRSKTSWASCSTSRPRRSRRPSPAS
jgi:DNA-binding GntR family transcriptional regulator